MVNDSEQPVVLISLGARIKIQGARLEEVREFFSQDLESAQSTYVSDSFYEFARRVFSSVLPKGYVRGFSLVPYAVAVDSKHSVIRQLLPRRSIFSDIQALIAVRHFLLRQQKGRAVSALSLQANGYSNDFYLANNHISFGWDGDGMGDHEWQLGYHNETHNDVVPAQVHIYARA